MSQRLRRQRRLNEDTRRTRNSNHNVNNGVGIRMRPDDIVLVVCLELSPSSFPHEFVRDLDIKIRAKAIFRWVAKWRPILFAKRQKPL